MKKEKMLQSDYLTTYKCQYCDGTHCTPCRIDKQKHADVVEKQDLYEEPRTK